MSLVTMMEEAQARGRSKQRVARHVPRFFLAGYVLSSILLGVVGCADKQTYPVDREPPSAFLLGPEDILVVTVWRNQDLSREVVVRPDGIISMPLIGDVQAAGLSTDILGRRIAERLTEFMANPNVSVQVKEVKSYFFYVAGEVSKPGKYSLQSYATVLQGVSMAGGFTPFATKNKMQVVRTVRVGTSAHEIRIPVGFDDLVSGKSAVGNFMLRSGDTIVVP